MNENKIDKYLEEPSKSIIPSVVGGFVGAAGAMLAGEAIKWLTTHKPKAFSENELKRHKDLVVIYRESFGDAEKIPSFWQLTPDNRPMFSVDYGAEMEKIQLSIDRLIAQKDGMYFARAKIFALLRKYLDSINKRRLDGGRKDGVEAMFLLEMLIWLRCVLPELEKLDDGIILDTQNTINHDGKGAADDGHGAKFHNTRRVIASENRYFSIHATLNRRVNYLNKIVGKVTRNQLVGGFIDLDSGKSTRLSSSGVLTIFSGRANFKSLVHRLKEQFENYVDFLEQKSSIIRFNGLINTTSSSLSELSILGFNILPLLINGINQPDLIVPQFLSPYASDVKTIALKKTVFGQWIEKTLFLAGIKNDSFVSQKRLTLEAINTHLEKEVPTDVGFKLGESLCNPLDEGWGHHQFVLDNSEEIKATEYIQQIRQLHRSLLMIYYVNQNMLKAATIASVYGEVWIYGSEIGKIILEELLFSINEANNDFGTTFKRFWTDYFTAFNLHSEDKGKDDARNKVYDLLHNYIENKLKVRMYNVIKAINSHVDRIRAHATTLPEITEETQRIQIELYQDILDFMIFKHRENSDNFSALKNALDKLTRDIGLIPREKVISAIADPKLPKTKTKLSRLYNAITGTSSKPKVKQDMEDLISLPAPVEPLPILVPIPGVIHEVEGDGNCFFRAIAFELNRQSGFEEHTHEKIRAISVKYITDNLAQFSEHFTEDESIETYIEEMRQDKVWAVGTILEAAALAFNMHLYIFDISYDREGVKTCPFHINEEKKGEKRDYTIGLVRQDLHYNALELPVSNNTPKTVKSTPNIEKETPKPIPKSGFPETRITYRKGGLSTFESISLLLGAPVILDSSLAKKRKEPLLKEPKKFHSDFQKYIYKEFLYLNHSLKTNYLHVTGVVYRLWMENVERIVNLYNNVNAAFLLLYPNEGNYPNVSKFEMDMIDECLRQQINKEFMEHRFYRFGVSECQSPFSVETTKDMIHIGIDSKKIAVIRDDIFQQAQDLVKTIPTVIEEQEVAIKEKEVAIKEKEVAIKENISLKKLLSDETNKIAKSEKIILSKGEEISALRRQLAELGVEPKAPRPRSPGMF